ncbi:MAG: aminoglycoside phosphotransferase family protein [Kouleothrix sp.]
MLEKPDLNDQRIITCLHDEYGLSVAQIAFLPLGADMNTAVYRVVGNDETPYFVKLRRGDFNEAVITVPKFLSDQGIIQIIPALTTQRGQLWASLDPFRVILYPFVAGYNGFEVNLSDQQRIEFGTALKNFHTAKIPEALTKGIRRETFSSEWRDKVRSFLERIEDESFDEPVAVELAAFLKRKRGETLELVNRSEQLAQAFQRQLPEFILCHADIHAWNLLIDVNGRLYLVDWDTLMFAPKERDLMFIGAGLGGNGHSLEEEERLFYQGYGSTAVDPIGIAYYRSERIIEDIAVYCEQLLLSEAGGADRAESFEALKANYLPNGTIAIARESDAAYI